MLGIPGYPQPPPVIKKDSCEDKKNDMPWYTLQGFLHHYYIPLLGRRSTKVSFLAFAYLNHQLLPLKLLCLFVCLKLLFDSFRQLYQLFALDYFCLVALGFINPHQALNFLTYCLKTLPRLRFCALEKSILVFIQWLL